jgi:DNA-binding transcriptional LysR family regulator
LDLSQLEMLVATVEAGGVQKAAERVYRTQPAVSMALRKLEDELGSPLFDRSNRGAYILTPAGELLYASAKRILRMRDEAVAEIHDLQQLHIGRIRIGANESTSNYLIPKFIRAFREKFPGIMVDAYRQNSARLIQDIKDGSVDVAFVSVPPEDKQIDALPVKDDELVLIVNPKHRFAGTSGVHIRDLGTETFIAHNVRSRSRDKVVDAFRQAETPLRISMEISTLDTIKRLVAMNLGLAFVPRMCVEEELARGDVVSIEVTGFSYRRTVWLAHRRSEALSNAAREFTAIVMQSKPW